MKNIFKSKIFRTWFTGLIVIFAGLGYVFYGIVWAYRFVMIYKKFFLFFFFSILIILITISSFVFLPLQKSNQSIEIVIQKGTSLKEVAQILKKNNIIYSKNVFIFWMRLTNKDKKIQAGKVVFGEKESIFSVSKKLLLAKPIEVIVTIPEGLTIEQTAETIQKKLNINYDRFIELCKDTLFIKQNFLLNIPSLEGYLFPNTYRFPPDISEELIIKKMVENFKINFDTISKPSNMELDLSNHQIVILASIIEKEAAVADERPLISGVFYNRLKKGIPLGADPTIRYILNKFAGPLYVSDLSIKSPYNTRLYKGLPPTPICSPGLASLKAAFSPQKTDMLYFVAKWDGSGRHDFSKTNQEHTIKKIKIRQNNEKRLKNISVAK